MTEKKKYTLRKDNNNYDVIWQLAVLHNSRQAFTYLECTDTRQAETILQETAQVCSCPYIGWHPLRGFYSSDTAALKQLVGANVDPASVVDPMTALTRIFGGTTANPGEAAAGAPRSPTAVYGMHEFRLLLKCDTISSSRPTARLLLAHLMDQITSTVKGEHSYRQIVFVADESPATPMRPEWQDLTAFVYVPRPNKRQLRTQIVEWLADQTLAKPSEERIDRLAEISTGLTIKQTLDTLSRCLAISSIGLDSAGTEEQIEKAKVASISNRTEALTYKPRSAIRPISELCGFDRYLQMLHETKLAMSAAGVAARLDGPRGVGIIGIPGTAKSLLLEASSVILEAPLLMVDVGALLGCRVGETEKSVRSALRQAIDMGRSVLMLDEIDKALGSAMNSSGDSGVTARILAAFLMFLGRDRLRADQQATLNRVVPEYLQTSYLNSPADVFVVMSMNRIAGLPAELFRPGRLDALYYTELPDEQIRLEIFKKAFAKRGDVWKPSEKEEHEISLATEYWTGAEIDATVGRTRSRMCILTGKTEPNHKLLMSFIADYNRHGTDYSKYSPEYNSMLAEAAKKAIPVRWKAGDVRPEQQLADLKKGK